MAQPTAKFHDGNEMSLFGLGTYKIVEQGYVDNAIDAALGAGYRMFDTAKFYHNEKQIGEALKKFLPKYNLKRSDVFIITKLWPELEDNFNKTVKGVEESLINLQTDYVDLILIHYPKSNERPDEDKEANQQARKDIWLALEQAKSKKQVRSIGVSNFEPHHILELKNYSSEVPVLNQVEFHPHFTRQNIRDFCKEHNIVFQAYSALARQNEVLVNEPILKNIAKKHNVSVSVVLLSFLVTQGYSVVAKSATKSRILENFTATKVKLTPDEIEEIYTLNKDQPYIRGTPWNVQ
uniref:NADP-dependent oxidoreductase domain-containing protein n=1 Tax=Panagrolaimus sp. JU765 TaxID=591449 RepID=A0AC34Q600_9BILA